MKKLSMFLLVGVLSLASSFSALAGTLQAYSSSGILSPDGSTPLKGDPNSGYLVQLIHAGDDQSINPPNADGTPGGDDTLIGETHIGYGVLSIYKDQGKFSKLFTSDDLIVTGAVVYVRAWNGPVADPSTTAYGESKTHTIQNSNFDSNDFGTFALTDSPAVPVELAAFNVQAFSDRVILNWRTETETDNIGFHIFRTTLPDGKREKVTSRMIDGAGNSSSARNYKWDDTDVQVEKSYRYWLASVSTKGVLEYHGPKSVMVLGTPEDYILSQNYPNPFNPATTIHYALKETGSVRLTVHNIRGQIVRELVNSTQHAGQYAVEWNGQDQNGNFVPSGVYLYTFEVNGFKSTQKMILTK